VPVQIVVRMQMRSALRICMRDITPAHHRELGQVA
jgi:hypothetical protein